MTLFQQSDAELIHAYMHGNEQALEVLINRYKDKIYTSVYMLVKDKYLAEDIFQDAFLKMIKTIRRWQVCRTG
jgi:RNA polymerase sigma-70 factor (ECF subfamily)